MKYEKSNELRKMITEYCDEYGKRLYSISIKLLECESVFKLKDD